jgi:hypothetical protein
LETSTNDCVGLQEIYAIGLSSISISYAVRLYIHAAVRTPDRVTTGVEMSIPSNAMLGGKQEKIMGTVSSRYIGNLHEKGRPGLNLHSFDLESDDDEFAVSELSRQATEFMDLAPIATATLAITKNGKGFRTVELENKKHAHWP